MDKVSDIIRKRLVLNGVDFKANDNIADHLKKGELEKIQKEVEEGFMAVFDSLLIDRENDWNSEDSPKRLAKMLCQEIFNGRYSAPPKITAFPNASKYDQLYVVGPIAINSTCAHHWQPFNGFVWVGVTPGSKVIGLSKFHRLCKYYAERPQIQEELTEQIAKAVQEATDAPGVAVLIKAKHFCVCNRGVRDTSSQMITSKLTGNIRETDSLKQEFFQLVSQLKEPN